MGNSTIFPFGAKVLGALRPAIHIVSTMTTDVPPAPEQAPVNPLVLALKSLLLVLFCGCVGYLAAKKANLGLVPGAVIGISLSGVGFFALMKLRGAPREMGFTFGLKFLSVTAYKVLNTTLVLWLASDMGYSKESALALIAGWSILMSIITLLAGSITDALGLRRTLLIGVTLCVLTRLVMVFSPSPALALICGLFPLAVGEALCTPVLVAALRRYSSPSQRSVAFSLFYALMNFGFMVAYFVFDGVRESLANGGSFYGLSDYRTLLLSSTGIELLMFPLILFLRRGAEMTPHGLVVTPETKKYPDAGFFQSVKFTVCDAARDTGRLFAGLVKTAGFYQLMVFLLMIGFLKVVFNVMDYILPTFAIQELGADARVGRFNAINGILILILAPAIGLLTQKFSAYSMVILGGFITALSFIFIIVPPAVFQGAADGWLGKAIGNGYMELKGSVHPYYVMIALWQVLFSVGEAFYSPRVYEYASSIAPKGQEASYASLSYVPLLIGKLITGAAFGGLLAKYCPPEGPRDPGTMWLIIGSLVLVAPVGLLVMKPFIRVKEEGREA
ncbi:MAG: MFS transporter [Luteolibacter sp.]